MGEPANYLMIKEQLRAAHNELAQYYDALLLIAELSACPEYHCKDGSGTPCWDVYQSRNDWCPACIAANAIGLDSQKLWYAHVEDPPDA